MQKTVCSCIPIAICNFIARVYTLRNRVPPTRGALERLERYEDERLMYRSEGAWA
jgi:hypothetical protein